METRSISPCLQDRPLAPILSQIKSVSDPSPYVFKKNFNIILCLQRYVLEP